MIFSIFIGILVFIKCRRQRKHDFLVYTKSDLIDLSMLSFHPTNFHQRLNTLERNEFAGDVMGQKLEFLVKCIKSITTK
jgi:hypothetical protein